MSQLNEAVDWKSRALEAEQRLAKAQKKLMVLRNLWRIAVLGCEKVEDDDPDGERGL